MSSTGKHKSAMMSAEVTPGPSTDVEKAIAEGDTNASPPSKKIKTETEDTNSYMKRTFDARRSFITVELPPIIEVKETYPELFTDKQIMMEFQRITDIDLDISLQRYCVDHKQDISDMCRRIPSAKDILTQAEMVKKEIPALEPYWDMVVSLCLIPYMMKENLCDMVIEIGEDEQVDPKGKIVPVLISKGKVFSSDEFILVVEEEIVQVFEEFTIAFASLFATYWIFNMEYPDTLLNTYNFIQKVMVNLKDGSGLPNLCREIQQKLIKLGKTRSNKEKPK
ncbi:uncharacterized protein LOC127857139 [Dreissena polymorpha]|uniref:Uncharacterized protein n=1 Tax=Dreissena polymorpha TaxID=45954 RepID=A0A9D4N9H6_DREPO|nr:uncharacterized protein LOC127857139 [Dreissena polymorpha]KAH3892203.1 hypothetical protein DPMN_016317 [Dreissena polymorpha]